MKTLHWFGFIGQVLVGIAMIVLCFSFLFSWTLGWPGYSWGLVPWPLLGLVFMGLMGLCMLVFWVLGGRGMVSSMRSFRCGLGRYSMFHLEESSLDILEKRLARGEITKEQFEGMKRHLSL